MKRITKQELIETVAEQSNELSELRRKDDRLRCQFAFVLNGSGRNNFNPTMSWEEIFYRIGAMSTSVRVGEMQERIVVSQQDNQRLEMILMEKEKEVQNAR